jgi:hypothetical protein
MPFLADDRGAVEPIIRRGRKHGFLFSLLSTNYGKYNECICMPFGPWIERDGVQAFCRLCLLPSPMSYSYR